MTVRSKEAKGRDDGYEKRIAATTVPARAAAVTAKAASAEGGAVSRVARRAHRASASCAETATEALADTG